MRAPELAVAALIAAFPAHAQMYKCVDERGVTHYSDQPHASCKATKVNIRPIPPVSGKVTPANRDVAELDAEFKRRQLERERAGAVDQTAIEQRCVQLRQEQAWLSGGTRISKLTTDGQQIYVDDSTRDVRLGQVREELRRCP